MLKALLMVAVAAASGGKFEEKKEQPTEQQNNKGTVNYGSEWGAFKAWCKNNGGVRL